MPKCDREIVLVVHELDLASSGGKIAAQFRVEHVHHDLANISRSLLGYSFNLVATPEECFQTVIVQGGFNLGAGMATRFAIS